MKNEPVDILDENGNQTGQVLMKQEAHDRGLWHPIVHLWIYSSKGQVLLQKRSPKKVVHPNVWDISVGGHVAAGDTPAEAALKEAKEELGLKLNPKNLSFMELTKFEEQMPAGWWNRFFAWNYTTPLDLNIDDLTIEKAEISQVRWFEPDELMKMINDPEQSKNFTPDFGTLYRTAIAEIHRRLNNA